MIHKSIYLQTVQWSRLVPQSCSSHWRWRRRPERTLRRQRPQSIWNDSLTSEHEGYSFMIVEQRFPNLFVWHTPTGLSDELKYPFINTNYSKCVYLNSFKPGCYLNINHIKRGIILDVTIFIFILHLIDSVNFLAWFDQVCICTTTTWSDKSWKLLQFIIYFSDLFWQHIHYF